MLFPLKDRKTIAEGTTEITLSIPLELRDTFVWKPGQHIDAVLPVPRYTDERGASRLFSLSSTPQNKESITFAFRNSGSAWKRHVLEMELGGPIDVTGPFGFFTLPKKIEKPLVFIAGGIGIVPFMSMVRHTRETDLAHQITLLYANNSPEHAAYEPELKTYLGNSLISHYGPLSKEILTNTPRQENTRFYIAGPVGMVALAVKALEESGIPSLSILTEEFTGYN